MGYSHRRKTCTRCHCEKSIRAFYPSKQGKYHRDPVCAQCRRAARRAAYRRNLAAERLASRVRQANIRAARAGAAGVITVPEIEALLAASGGQCAYCGARLTEDSWQLDHFLPLALKGDNTAANIRISCPACNNRKAAAHPFLWVFEHVPEAPRRLRRKSA